MNLSNISFDWTPISLTITTLGGIIAGTFGLYKYYKSRQYKSMHYSIVADSPLADIHDDISDFNNIKVMVGNKKVKNVRFVALRIRNSGNVPIKQEDFDTNLWFLDAELFRTKNLINATVYATEPVGIQATTMFVEDIDKIGLNKVLLNPGDAIFVNMLLADYQDTITVNGRIVGVKEIKQEQFIVKQPTTIGYKIGSLIGYLLVIIVPAIILAAPISYFLHQEFLRVFVITFITLISMFLAIYLPSKLKLLFVKQ